MGLLVGDILLEYDGREFDSVAQFIQYRGQETDGATRLLRMLRDGEIKTFEVSPGKMGATLGPAFWPQETLDAAREKAGIEAKTDASETPDASNAVENVETDVDVWFNEENGAARP